MKVVGVQEMKGTSKKTGKSYDAVMLHCCGSREGVVGEHVEEVWVPRDVWDREVAAPYESVVGMEVFPSYDRRGFLQQLNMQ